MHDPPKLSEAEIIAALREHYGIAVRELAFLPGGADTASFVYRADDEAGQAHFVKLRAAARFSPRSLAVPHYLAQRGVPHLLAPRASRGGAPWAELGAYMLTVYPLLEARMAADAGLSQAQWRKLGAAVRQIHDSPLPPELRRILPTERFTPWRRGQLDSLDDAVAQADPAARELVECWQARRDEIRALVARCDELAAEMRRAELPLALCHADMHTWNTLVGADGALWLVDWDETMLAPKERDLMFVIGGIGRDLVRPHETAAFLAGYGAAAIDARALTYYRYAWAVQDLAAYAEEALLTPDASPEARRDAAKSFVAQLAKGNIVDIARESDRAGD